VSAKAHIRSLAGNEGGASALELALVLPVFLTLLFAIFQFGMAQHKLSSLRYALNTASRAVMLNPALTQAQVEAKVKGELSSLADPNVTVTMAVVNTASGKVARLTGIYSTSVGIPTVATYPIDFTTTVDAALPET
jgi:Flp pilus assembly protein TadG